VRTAIPWRWWLRVAVSGVVLVVLFHFVPIADVWRAARRISPLLWLPALAVFLAGHAAAAAKWRLLIGPGVPFAEAFRAHLAGLAANLCLPGLAGGDVVRAAMVYRHAGDKVRLLIGSAADRLLDIFGLVLLCGLGATFAWGIDPGDRQTAQRLLGLGALLLLLAFPASIAIERSLPAAVPEGRLARGLADGVRAAAALARAPVRLVACLTISLCVQATFVAINIAFADALAVAAPPGAWLFAWAAAKIVAIAPISLGGLGVREAALARLMSGFGADAAQVVAIGLVWQTLLYAAGLAGALVQVFWGTAPRPAVENAAPAPAQPRSEHRG
jgi:uncharacterized membrane protein YbhN (UPF0104 family)